MSDSLSRDLLIDEICRTFEAACRDGTYPLIESYLDQVDADGRELLLRELLAIELELQIARGVTPARQAYHQRFADHVSLVDEVYRHVRRDALAETEPRQLGSYQITRKIGEGGMGCVYKAIHTAMRREVALKILPPRLMGSEAAISRFRREVEASARLDHPNIITALDAGEVDGVHYLAMKFCPGKDLSRLVKRHGPLPARSAVKFILQAARGLAYAHQQGVVHRDIKPANLLLDREGVVRILDMGLARLSEESQDDGVTVGAELTQAGVVVGSPEFMAPEQMENPKLADARADIYSLGCSLYYLITAGYPFLGETAMQRLIAHREQPIPDLTDAARGVDAELNRIFQKMLAKNLGDRQQTMQQVIDELEGWLQRSENQRPASAASESTTRNTTFVITAVLILTLLVAGLALLISIRTKPEPPAPTSAPPEPTIEPVERTEPPVPATPVVSPAPIDTADPQRAILQTILNADPGNWAEVVFDEHDGKSVKNDADIPNRPFDLYAIFLTTLTSQRLAYVSKLPYLHEIHAYDTDLRDEDLVHLTDHPTLAFLNIGGTDVTDQGLTHLRDMPALHHIHVNATAITDAGLKHFQHLSSLEMLSIGGTLITHRGLVHLAAILKLKELTLWDCERIGPDALPILKQMTNLTKLDVRATTLSDLDVQQLRETLPNTMIIAVDEDFPQSGEH